MSSSHIYGQLLLIEVPVITAFAGTVIGFIVKRNLSKSDDERKVILATLNTHSESLAALTHAVYPEGQKALPEVMQQLTTQVTVLLDRGKRNPPTDPDNPPVTG